MRDLGGDRSRQSVSCVTTALGLDFLDYLGLSAEPVLDGFPHAPQFLANHRNRIEYPVFLEFERRLARAIAGSSQSMYDFGRFCFCEDRLGYFRAFLHLVVSPMHAFAFVPTILSGMIFPCFQVEFEGMGASRGRMWCRCGPDLHITDETILTFQGQFSAFPILFGEPEATVQAHRMDRCAVRYDILVSADQTDQTARWTRRGVRPLWSAAQWLVERLRARKASNPPPQITSEKTAELSSTRALLAEAIDRYWEMDRHRERATEALASSERRYRTLAEASPDLICVLGPDGRVQYINASGAAFFGLPVLEMLGSPFPTQTRQEAHETLEPHVREVVETGRPQRFETPILQGEVEFWFDTRLVPVQDDTGQVREIILIARDVTVRRREEREKERLVTERVQAQKLESLGVLAGGIAHDFNNLLVSVVANAELAAQRVDPGNPIRQHLVRINEASLRATELCRLMLAYAGREPMSIGPVDVGKLVEELRPLVESLVTKKAELEYVIDPGLPAVEADASQLRQIVVNLLTNAAESLGAEGGRVTVTVSSRWRVGEELRGFLALGELALGELAPGSYVSLTVRDTGGGMDEETRRKAFEPFFSTKFPGRGLGLSAVLGAVRGHRGAIRVTSAIGQGSCFEVILPAGDLSAMPLATVVPIAPVARIEKDLRGQGNVLIVDDERGVREVVQEILESAGYAVVTANNGREALEIFEERGGDLTCVVLDLAMPQLDGVDTLREMRRRLPSLPILLTSGYSEQEVLSRFAGLEPFDFVAKPFQMVTLLAAMHRTLDTRESPSHADGEVAK